MRRTAPLTRAFPGSGLRPCCGEHGAPGYAVLYAVEHPAKPNESLRDLRARGPNLIPINNFMGCGVYVAVENRSFNRRGPDGHAYPGMQ